MSENGSTEAVTDFDELYPEPVTVQLRTGPVELRPLTIMEFGATARAVRVAVAAINGGDRLMDFVEERIADLLPFVAASSGMSKEALGKLYGGDFMQLFAGALDANESFFGRCFGLVYGRTGTKLMEILGGVGPQPSTTSAAADTPTANATPPIASAAS